MTTGPLSLPEHWNLETRRLAAKLSTVQAQPALQDLGLLAIATELADLRKALGPQTYTEVIGKTLNRMGRDSSIPAELMPREHQTSGFALHRAMPEDLRTATDLEGIKSFGAGIRQVGWYCPGGHPAEDTEMLVEPNLRLSDPCAHGVPVYVLVRG